MPKSYGSCAFLFSADELGLAFLFSFSSSACTLALCALPFSKDPVRGNCILFDLPPFLEAVFPGFEVCVGRSSFELAACCDVGLGAGGGCASSSEEMGSAFNSSSVHSSLTIVLLSSSWSSELAWAFPFTLVKRGRVFLLNSGMLFPGYRKYHSENRSEERKYTHKLIFAGGRAQLFVDSRRWMRDSTLMMRAFPNATLNCVRAYGYLPHTRVPTQVLIAR